jgi:predicted PilT family ATPase
MEVSKGDKQKEVRGADESDENEVVEEEQLCGVIVIGAPGAGKTTFCNALQ